MLPEPHPIISKMDQNSISDSLCVSKMHLAKCVFSFQKVFLLRLLWTSCDITVARVTPVFFFFFKENNRVNKHVNRLWCYVNSSESVIVTLTMKKKPGIYLLWPPVWFGLNLKCVRDLHRRTDNGSIGTRAGRPLGTHASRQRTPGQ